MLLLAKVEETAQLREDVIPLSVNRYPDTLHPEGHKFLKSFAWYQHPTFTYGYRGVEIVKEILVPKGLNGVLVKYRSTAPVTLHLRPLVNLRSFHLRSRQKDLENLLVASSANKFTVGRPPEPVELHVACEQGRFVNRPEWSRDMTYDLERERGTSPSEDHFSPGFFEGEVAPQNEIVLTATTTLEPFDNFAPKAPQPPSASVMQELLGSAAEAFIITKPGSHAKSIIAGYHWFEDWGRDAMISIPGLLHLKSDFGTARAVLLEFARASVDGLVPKRMADTSMNPEYDSVDTSLWFLYTAGMQWKRTRDSAFVQEIYPYVQSILGWYMKGTRFGIAMDSDGLLTAVAAGHALTWMDARVDGVPVTPRYGKPVEVNALWFNGLMVASGFAEALGRHEDSERLTALAARVKKSFNAKFWNPTSSCLFDCIEGLNSDASIRPNQIFAVSLPHPVLDPARFEAVVEAVLRHLVTPYGLRTLSPFDPHYQGRYEGDPRTRDLAYHQGTVWPWLVAFFFEACARARYRREKVRPALKQVLVSLESHLQEAGLGTVSEIFDGDAPHRPRGCISQAWSVAEVLRLSKEVAPEILQD